VAGYDSVADSRLPTRIVSTCSWCTRHETEKPSTPLASVTLVELVDDDDDDDEEEEEELDEKVLSLPIRDTITASGLEGVRVT